MARWHRLSMIALILLVVWGCAKSISLEGQVVDGKGQPRFKAENGVITDSATGLDWYVGPTKTTTGTRPKPGRRISPWPGAAGVCPPFPN